jgi:hypothetical protein
MNNGYYMGDNIDNFKTGYKEKRFCVEYQKNIKPFCRINKKFKNINEACRIFKDKNNKNFLTFNVHGIWALVQVRKNGFCHTNVYENLSTFRADINKTFVKRGDLIGEVFDLRKRTPSIIFNSCFSRDCFSVSANDKVKKYPVIAEVDGRLYRQNEDHNEFSTGTYCKEGRYIKKEKKFCNIAKHKKEPRVCNIINKKDKDYIHFCVNGNWSELYHKKTDGTCLTYLYDELLDISEEEKRGLVKKGSIIGWADSKERTKPVIVFNGCHK